MLAADLNPAPCSLAQVYACSSPPQHRRRNRIFLSHHHPLLASIGVVSHRPLSLSPSLPLSALVPRAGTRASPVEARRLAPLSPPAASPTLPRLGLGHVRNGPRNTSRNNRVHVRRLAPARARVPRATPRSNARARHARRRPRERAHPSVDPNERSSSIVRSFDRSTDRTHGHDRAGRWRPSGPLGAVDRIRRPAREARIRSRDWTTRRRRKRRRDAEHGSAKSRLDRARERLGERTRGEERIARIEDDVSRKEEAREG